MKNGILVTCNAGSTNSKLAVFDAQTLACIAHQQTKNADETLAWLRSIADNNILAIAHRVVHGGGKYTLPVILNDEVRENLAGFIPLAPLHQPSALHLIEKISVLYPAVAQIACFDTAFHATVPDIELRFPLPPQYIADGVRKYGFHGLSYEYIASVLPEYMDNASAESSKIVVAHLGGGASACAMLGLKSVASTMGFSTLDGLMMGTRCGSLDAGVVLHMAQHKNMSIDEIERLLYKQAGLLGVSGISGEMKELLASKAPEAMLAIDMFCYSAAKQISGLLPSLGGMDALVFTGGIGANCEDIRSKILAYLSWLKDLKIYVIPTNEELVMAKSCVRLLQVTGAITKATCNKA